MPGEVFYTWKKRVGGTSYMHTRHGYPKPSMLSNRKTAIIEDAVQDADFGGCENVDDVLALLEGIADEAEGVGEEYEASADNMPENLQYGAQAEAMREVADELRAWAESLRAFEPSEDEPTEAAKRDEWLEDIRTEAQDVLGELPEYQG